MMFLMANKDNNFAFLSSTRFAEANRCNLEDIGKVFLFQNITKLTLKSELLKCK